MARGGHQRGVNAGQVSRCGGGELGGATLTLEWAHYSGKIMAGDIEAEHRGCNRGHLGVQHGEHEETTNWTSILERIL